MSYDCPSCKKNKVDFPDVSCNSCIEKMFRKSKNSMKKVSCYCTTYYLEFKGECDEKNFKYNKVKCSACGQVLKVEDDQE